MWQGFRLIAKYPDPYQPGRKIWAGIRVELRDSGELSIQGVVGVPQSLKVGNADSCGQNIDNIANIHPKYFVDGWTREDHEQLIAIWKRWHLNHLNAGSPRQEQYLREHPVKVQYPDSHYDKASAVLTEAGLNPDEEFIYTYADGESKPYRYGSAWIKEELPEEVKLWAKEVMS